ncbi:sensor histidine kinase [Microbacterium sp. IEGM 1404]|uniref:sensor histidine kinase n=1 Tax=Microbacterium sp. IEGM 1404 TaxID=3047084 RepID=UPI0024B80137|nr:histidine kinase [Microbacterium sp. IEGM 1404]MDI9892488.1 histidine kinase [Microbacterium sp. IEGM 1404]
MTTRLSEPGTLLDETAPEAVVTPPISAVARTLRSPVFVAVVFVATVVQVCSDPVLAIFSGTGQWDHTLPPQAVIALTAFICLAQAVCVSRSGTRPELGMLGAVACYLVVAVALGVPTWATPMQLVVAISMAALGSARRIPVAATWAAGTVAVSAVALGGWAASVGAPPEAVAAFLLTEGVSLASLSFAGVALGALYAVLERRAECERRRAADIQLQQAEAIEASRAAERGRIAQELHDVAGQHLAGLVSLCDASADLAPAHPQQALQLIDEVRAEGRYAAASLYGALGDLRAVEATAHTPTPDLRHIEGLVEFWRERGKEVSAEIEGDPEILPAVVSTTAYRAIQEALSNAAKHAAGAPIGIQVRIRPDRLVAVVQNGPPRRPRTDERGLGLGWGLDNLRQKLTLVDGTLAAGADGTGGWRVEVEIPLPRTMEA